MKLKRSWNWRGLFTSINNYKANTVYLLRDSIYESLLYLFLGFILQGILTNIYLFFAIGVLLHILAEKLMVHRDFCRKSCTKE